jgi:hypothetical protein
MMNAIIRSLVTFGVELPIDFAKLLLGGSCWHIELIVGTITLAGFEQ